MDKYLDAQLSERNIIGTSGDFLFTISCRIPEDDDDCCYIVRADTLPDARSKAEALMLEEAGYGDEEAERIAKVYGASVIHLLGYTIGRVTPRQEAPN